MRPNPRALDAAMQTHHASRTVVVGLLAAVWALACPSAAYASLLSPEAEDALATYIAIFALFFVPILLIVLFWMVHVLPEKIAHKRHHPQLEAIKTLCLLSLVFGGLLWPIAWLWAYTKPVLHKLAYGTDRITHDETHEAPPAAPPAASGGAAVYPAAAETPHVKAPAAAPRS
jgi:CBS domain containing-hemolysin-like protein